MYNCISSNGSYVLVYWERQTGLMHDKAVFRLCYNYVAAVMSNTVQVIVIINSWNVMMTDASLYFSHQN